jgi:2',3'-cyclic-nucleotide 2'-phosphodiesterase (5'-nucleotidase family)
MKFIYWLLLFIGFLILVTALIIFTAILAQNEEEDFEEKNRELFELSIIHFSDFHARFDEINEETLLPCNEANEDEVCIGGIARMKTVIEDLKARRPNAIVLNAGDNFQGTLWYNLLRHNVTSHFLNFLPIDANVLGNHEFAHGIDGLMPFIKSLNSSFVVANVDSHRQLDFHTLNIKVSDLRGGNISINRIRFNFISSSFSHRCSFHFSLSLSLFHAPPPPSLLTPPKEITHHRAK